MPFETNLLAISHKLGDHSIISKHKDEVGTNALFRDNLFVEVSKDLGYRDYAAVVSYGMFQKYAGKNPRVLKWYRGLLNNDVTFIIVTLSEWESGM